MERKSRRLSYILRHCPESIGLELDDHGYGDVQKILEALNITIEDLDMIVREDENSVIRIMEITQEYVRIKDILFL